jgi:hypothetical protein
LRQGQRGGCGGIRGLVPFRLMGEQVGIKARFAHTYSVYSTLFKCMSNNEKYLMTINSFQKIPLLTKIRFFFMIF